MAAVTASSVMYIKLGNSKNAVMATLGAIADADTWATGLATVELCIPVITDAAAAADALTVTTYSGGTVTFGVAGTISGARAIAIGT